MIKMKFKFQYWIFCAAFMFSLFLTVKAEAQTFNYDGINYRILSSDQRTATVASNTAATGNVVIPSTVNYDGESYEVISISKEAFKDSDMDSVYMSEGLRSIEGDAFIKCRNLKTIIVPNTVTSVGNGSFAYCSGVTSITYGKNVKNIGKDIFTGMSSLKSVTSLNPTPPSVDTWGVTTTSAVLYVPQGSINAYRNATVWKNFTTIEALPIAFGNLTSLIVGNIIESIDSTLFQDCTMLNTLVLGSNLIEIGEKSFKGCSNLSEVIIPPSVETIGASAFAGDSRLESIIMGHSVKTIGEKAFDGCKANTVSITAQTPPTAPNNTFSNYSGKLYLQGENAKDAYYDAFTCWDRFDSYVMIEAEEIRVEGTGEISGEPGDTFQLTASIWPENVTLPQIFWRSTNPEIATVDENGLVTLHADLKKVLTRAQGEGDIDGSCTIIAETLYNDGPVAQVTVDNTGFNLVESIPVGDNGSIDYSLPYDVYNMNGLKVGENTKGLDKGIYIIRQGKAAVKTVVR